MMTYHATTIRGGGRNHLRLLLLVVSALTTTILLTEASVTQLTSSTTVTFLTPFACESPTQYSTSTSCSAVYDVDPPVSGAVGPSETFSEGLASASLGNSASSVHFTRYQYDSPVSASGVCLQPRDAVTRGNDQISTIEFWGHTTTPALSDAALGTPAHTLTLSSTQRASSALQCFRFSSTISDVSFLSLKITQLVSSPGIAGLSSLYFFGKRLVALAATPVQGSMSVSFLTPFGCYSPTEYSTSFSCAATYDNDPPTGNIGPTATFANGHGSSYATNDAFKPHFVRFDFDSKVTVQGVCLQPRASAPRGHDLVSKVDFWGMNSPSNTLSDSSLGQTAITYTLTAGQQRSTNLQCFTFATHFSGVSVAWKVTQGTSSFGYAGFSSVFFFGSRAADQAVPFSGSQSINFLTPFECDSPTQYSTGFSCARLYDVDPPTGPTGKAETFPRGLDSSFAGRSGSTPNFVALLYARGVEANGVCLQPRDGATRGNDLSSRLDIWAQTTTTSLSDAALGVPQVTQTFTAGQQRSLDLQCFSFPFATLEGTRLIFKVTQGTASFGYAGFSSLFFYGSQKRPELMMIPLSSTVNAAFTTPTSCRSPTQYSSSYSCANSFDSITSVQGSIGFSQASPSGLTSSFAGNSATTPHFVEFSLGAETPLSGLCIQPQNAAPQGNDLASRVDFWLSNSRSAQSMSDSSLGEPDAILIPTASQQRSTDLMCFQFRTSTFRGAFLTWKVYQATASPGYVGFSSMFPFHSSSITPAPPPLNSTWSPSTAPPSTTTDSVVSTSTTAPSSPVNPSPPMSSSAPPSVVEASACPSRIDDGLTQRAPSTVGFGYDAATAQTTQLVFDQSSNFIQRHSSTTASTDEATSTVTTEEQVKKTARYARVQKLESLLGLFGSYREMTTRATTATQKKLLHCEREQVMFLESATQRVHTPAFEAALLRVVDAATADKLVATYGTHIKLQSYFGVRAMIERTSTVCTSSQTITTQNKELDGLLGILNVGGTSSAGSSSTSFSTQVRSASATASLDGGPGDLDCLGAVGWRNFIAATEFNDAKEIETDLMPIAHRASGNARTLLQEATNRYIEQSKFTMGAAEACNVVETSPPSSRTVGAAATRIHLLLASFALAVALTVL